MSLEIAAGIKATYTGHSKNPAWDLRHGVECVVVQATTSDAKKIQVLFDCEEKEVSVCLAHLAFDPKDFSLH